ncbi:MAG TPA: hypothetical protein VIC35_08130 [Acidimicrobiia bacterium]
MNPPGRRAMRRSLPAALPAGTVLRKVSLHGVTREYLLTVPPALSTPAVAVLNLHGASSNMAQQAAYSQVPARAAQRGWVSVTPQGLGRIPRWNIPPMPGPDDVGFLGSILRRVERELEIEQWFGTGISNGAAMVTRLTSEWPGALRAVAPVAGINAAYQHPPSQPTPLIAFHGTDDRVVPYAGGRLFGGRTGPVRERWEARRGTVLELEGVESLVARFAVASGARPNPTITPIGTDVVRTVYTGAVVRTELYTIRGGGHTWPGAIDIRILGPTTHTIDATALMLDFFAGV